MSGDLEEKIKGQIRHNEQVFKAYQDYRAIVPALNSLVQKTSVRGLKPFVDLEFLCTKEWWIMEDTLKDVKKGFQYIEDEVSTLEYTLENISIGGIIGSACGTIAMALTGSLIPLALPVAGALLVSPIQHIQKRVRMKNKHGYAEHLNEHVQLFYGQCSTIQQNIDKKGYMDERQMLRSLNRFNSAARALKECIDIRGYYTRLVRAYTQWNN